MKNNLTRLMTSIAVALTLSACVNAGPLRPAQPDMTFAKYQTIPLAVAKIEIFEEYKSPMGGPNIEHEFQTPPSTAARNLIQSKLTPAGDQGVLRVFIDDASVKSQRLQVRDDFFGTFIREPSERYTGRVALRFELVREEAPDIVIGRANISSDRNNTIQENASLNDRDQAYAALTEALMNDIYDGLRTTVQQNFGTPR